MLPRPLLLAAFAVLTACAADPAPEEAPARRRPNVIVVLADDLGVAEVGSYGQRKIATPTLDGLAADGMRFTQAYSGSCVCAPARCVLLTGRHTGHSVVRDNHELGGWERGNREGQLPLPAGTETVATMLRREGYATAAIGKWGLGGPDTEGEPWRHGFDLWFGYLCQRQAHNYYPEHLWRNDEKVVLEGNTWKNVEGEHYAPDLMIDEAVKFVREHRDRPFFLYFATPVPHVAIQVPEDSLAAYEGRWEDPAYDGSKGYLPHPAPRAGYAAMVSRMDRDIGRLLATVEELGLGDDTVVVFTSDNGPTFNGGSDSEFFDSTGGLRGLKCDLYEGGIRVPLIVRWPGRIAPGTTTDHLTCFQDFLPTIAELAGGEPAVPHDGISFVPTLLGRGDQRVHDHLYWEYHARGGWQAVRFGDIKAVRRQVRRDPDSVPEIYDLSRDPAETTNLAATRPELARRAAALMAQRTPAILPQWNFPPPQGR